MSKKDYTSVKTRNYKFLLYADNGQHMSILDRIREGDPETFNGAYEYIGIAHVLPDGQGGVIMEGEGKMHYHVYLVFPSPRHVRSVCSALGLIGDDGLPDVQFVRPITGRFDNALVYLTHTNAPDKEQYTSDALFGSANLILRQKQACLKFARNEVDYSDSIIGCLDWIAEQDDQIIHITDFARWACSSRFFRGSSSPLVRAAIDEHNVRIYNARKDARISDIAEGVRGLQDRLDDTATRFYSDDSEGVDDL